jgi:hypothetical protein
VKCSREGTIVREWDDSGVVLSALVAAAWPDATPRQ